LRARQAREHLLYQVIDVRFRANPALEEARQDGPISHQEFGQRPVWRRAVCVFAGRHEETVGPIGTTVNGTKNIVVGQEDFPASTLLLWKWRKNVLV
jgi:hypothetical protein